MHAHELIHRATERLKRSSSRFSRAGDEEEQARELLEHVLGHAPRAREVVSAETQRRFDALVVRRCTGEPLPYIVGWTEFRSLHLRVRPGGFIPRQTSEFLAEQAIRRLRRRAKGAVAVDIATGVGPVAIAMAHAAPGARVVGADISAEALVQARANARALKLSNVSFHRGSLFEALPRALRGTVDVMTSHPPYVGRDEVRELPAELRKFEPKISLTDHTEEGMGLAREIIAGARDWLRPGGWLLIETGSMLARQTRALMTRGGYTDVRSTMGDLDYTRVLVARRARG